MYITIFILTILGPYPMTSQHPTHNACIRAGQSASFNYAAQTGKALQWSCRPESVYLDRPYSNRH